MTRGVAIVILGVCVVGCGNSALSPAEVAQNYVYEVAAGNYSAACALLEPPIRRALVSATGARVGCPGLFRRCLPQGTTVLRRDQTQLLYANTDLQIHGSRADVGLSGIAAARATKEVTLVDHRSRWRLTSPGRAIEQCVRRLSGQRGHRRRRRTAGG